MVERVRVEEAEVDSLGGGMGIKTSLATKRIMGAWELIKPFPILVYDLKCFMTKS